MKTTTRYTKATSDGAGIHYVTAQERSGASLSTSIVEFTGTGSGATPEEARADAYRALVAEKKDAMYRAMHRQ